MIVLSENGEDYEKRKNIARNKTGYCKCMKFEYSVAEVEPINTVCTLISNFLSVGVSTVHCYSANFRMNPNSSIRMKDLGEILFLFILRYNTTVHRMPNIKLIGAKCVLLKFR